MRRRGFLKSLFGGAAAAAGVSVVARHAIASKDPCPGAIAPMPLDPRPAEMIETLYTGEIGRIEGMRFHTHQREVWINNEQHFVFYMPPNPLL
jgi:hypothetical protein